MINIINTIMNTTSYDNTAAAKVCVASLLPNTPQHSQKSGNKIGLPITVMETSKVRC